MAKDKPEIPPYLQRLFCTNDGIALVKEILRRTREERANITEAYDAAARTMTNRQLMERARDLKQPVEEGGTNG